MLVLSRKKNEAIVLPQFGIRIVLVELRGDKARIGIDADKNIEVHREEVQEAIQRSGGSRKRNG